MSEFFVGLRHPVELRRSLLESSRVVLQALQSYEDLKDIRREKFQVAALFQNQLKEANNSIRRLRSALPKLPNDSKSKAVVSIEKDLEGIEKELSKLKG